MGGLAHYIEEEGIPTTQISLIREHTDIIQPPRALWVPFELGRPFGSPNLPDFQRDVLRHVLALLSYEEGPVLEEYPHDAEDENVESVQLACPVDFSQTTDDIDSMTKLFDSFRGELRGMQTWHDIYTATCLSTMGVSGLFPEDIAELFQNFVEGEKTIDRGDQRLSDILRMATDDLKTFYFEALSAQPGQPTNVAILSNWFWGKTIAAKMVNEVRKRCQQLATKDMLLAANLLLIPRNQMYRFKDEEFKGS